MRRCYDWREFKMAEPKAKKQKISEVTDVAGASRSMNETCMKIDLTKIKKEERRQFERSLRLAGLPPTLKLSDVVRGAMFTDGLPEVSPEQAGLMELFTHSAAMDDEEVQYFDMTDFTASDFESSDEDEAEDSDHMVVLHKLGMLGTVERKPTDIPKEKTGKQTMMLKMMFAGLSDMSRGSRLIGRGADKIRLVLMHCPELANLNALLSPMVQVYGSSHLPALPAPVPMAPGPGDRPKQLPPTCKPESNLPQVPSHLKLPSLPHHFAQSHKILPVRNGKEGQYLFACPVCQEKYKSWGRCEGHIRRVHTGWRYGPCPHCKTFTTYVRDSFKTHIAQTCPNRPNKE